MPQITSPTYTPTIAAAGPLTTVWTPPSFCGNAVLSGCSSFTGSGTSYTTTCSYVEPDHTCGSDGRPTRASDCFPPGADPSGIILYSPGVDCPVGWTVAVRTLDPASSITVTCCPSGFSAYMTVSCVASIDVEAESTVVDLCLSGGTLSSSTLTYTSSGDSQYVTMWAQQIRLALPPASETARFTAAGSALSSITTPSATAASDPDSDSTQRNSGERRKKAGLGTGAIVGIVVGVLVLLALVGALLFLRRRKRGQQMPVAAKNADSHQALPEYVGGNGVAPGPHQMTTTSSTGLFQPQPELRGPAR